MSKRSKSESSSKKSLIDAFIEEKACTKMLKLKNLIKSDLVIPLPQVLRTTHPNAHSVYTLLVEITPRRKYVNLYCGNQCPPLRAFWAPGKKYTETSLEPLETWHARLQAWIEQNENLLSRQDSLKFGPFALREWVVLLDRRYDVEDVQGFPTLQKLEDFSYEFENSATLKKELWKRKKQKSQLA